MFATVRHKYCGCTADRNLYRQHKIISRRFPTDLHFAAVPQISLILIELINLCCNENLIGGRVCTIVPAGHLPAEMGLGIVDCKRILQIFASEVINLDAVTGT